MNAKFIILLFVGVVTGTAMMTQAQVIANVDRRNPNTVSSLAQVCIAPGPLGDGVQAYVDRTHLFQDVPPILIGAEYVLMSNDDKDNPYHELQITIAKPCTLYLIIDNRVGTHVKDEAISPNLEAAGMNWVVEMGFVNTGMKMAVDEIADGILDNYYTMFSKPVLPGVIVLKAQNDVYLGGPLDRNMYGVAASSAPRKATNPIPVDGGSAGVSPLLQWAPGFEAVFHDVYFSKNPRFAQKDCVGYHLQTADCQLAEDLIPGVTYYWRVNEVQADRGTVEKGDTWSFTAFADSEAGDPNLMGWWKLDGLSSGAVVDSSGWGRDGVAYGQPSWVPGCAGLALELDGVDDYVDTNYREDLSQWTVTAWVASPRAPAQADVGGPVHRESNYQFNWDHDDSRFQGTATVRIGDTWHPASFGALSANQWHHLAATFDGASLNAYVNGELITTNAEAQGVPSPESATLKIGRHAGGPWLFTGSVDEVRVYNRALSQEEIEDVVFYDPLLAQDPQPVHRGAIDIHDVNDLSWSAGEAAAMHDVYLGTDANAVGAADVNSPVYWGRQTETSFSVAGVVESPGRYFWRIDEVQADGATVHKGRVWTFSVSGSVMIDDFQSYTDEEGSRIQDTWIDGATNNTGSQVGLQIDAFARRGNPTTGNRSMSMVYDNAGTPFYSEVSRVFWPPQDWTACMADALSLLIKGDVVTFQECPPEVFTLTAVGDDIWSNNDQFRYVFKRLDGDGSIVVRVVNVSYSHEWAKCGVMIRESLARDSAHAAMYITPDGRRAFQTRPTNGTGVCLTAHSSVGAVSTPYWVRLDRKGDQFTAYHSSDGVTWIQQPDDEEVTSYQSSNPTTISMPTTIYIGLALCSHTNGVVATAVFSDIETTGYVSDQWQMAEIGYDHPGNSPDDLYVVVEDANGASATVVNPDLGAVNVTEWTPWRIPLADFAGVDLTRIGKVSIGVGGRETSVSPGDGRLDIDNLILWKP